MQELMKLATFETKIGGIVFVMHRRSTALMLEIGNVSKVFGLVGGANAKGRELSVEQMKKAAEETAAMVAKTWQVALISINGEPADELGLTTENMAHVADPLFAAFLKSGLAVDPTPGS